MTEKRTCFGILAGATGLASLILIKEGEPGYYATEGYGPRSEELVDYFNAQQGITPAERAAFEFGSMFGWDLPGAQSDPHESHVTPLRIPGEHRDDYLERVKDAVLAKFHAKSLKVGQRVRVKVPVLVTGEDEEEYTTEAGALAQVTEVITLKNRQGFQICVSFIDDRGGYAYFDEADAIPFPLAVES